MTGRGTFSELCSPSFAVLLIRSSRSRGQWNSSFREQLVLSVSATDPASSSPNAVRITWVLSSVGNLFEISLRV